MADARSDAELAKELESLTLELVKRLDRRADLAKGDAVASDEVFVLAGHVYAVLRAASEQIGETRTRLDRSARGDGV